ICGVFRQNQYTCFLPFSREILGETPFFLETHPPPGPGRSTTSRVIADIAVIGRRANNHRGTPAAQGLREANLELFGFRCRRCRAMSAMTAILLLVYRAAFIACSTSSAVLGRSAVSLTSLPLGSTQYMSSMRTPSFSSGI